MRRGHVPAEQVRALVVPDIGPELAFLGCECPGERRPPGLLELPYSGILQEELTGDALSNN